MNDQPYDRVWMVASPGGLLESELPWPLEYDEPQRVRVEDDLFHEELSFEEIAAVFGIMRECPGLTFQVLTKRPRRMRGWFRWVDRATWRESDPSVGYVASQDEMLFHHLEERLDGAALEKWASAVRPADPKRYTWPLPNVRLGVTARTQAEWDERVGHLMECPAALRFVSCDPYVEEIEVRDALPSFQCPRCGMEGWGLAPVGCPCNAGAYGCPSNEGLPHGCITDERLVQMGNGLNAEAEFIDQLILGGDFGPGAKPCDVTAWPETIRQCRQAGVAVYVTHLGAKPFERTPVEMDWPGGFLVDDDDSRVWPILTDPKGGDPSEWPKPLQVREFPEVKP